MSDTCVPASAPKVCLECGKDAISMCPACFAYVHQDFGYNGPACSSRHEQRCEGARLSRVVPPPKIVVWSQAEIKNFDGSNGSNGSHKPAPKKKRNRQ